MAGLVTYFDFDGTITTEDYVVPFMAEFIADGDWQGLDLAYYSGDIGRFDLYQQLLIRLIGSREDHCGFIRQRGHLDTSFGVLVDQLHSLGAEVVILSDGIDIAVETLLPDPYRSLPCYTNRLKYGADGTIRKVDPDRPANGCRWCSNCKRRLIMEERRDRFVVVVGDGISDVCAVDEGDLVFATDLLVSICAHKNTQCLEFSHLGQLADFFQNGCRLESLGRLGLQWHGATENLLPLLQRIRLSVGLAEQETL